jgi:hypothetical protein
LNRCQEGINKVLTLKMQGFSAIFPTFSVLNMALYMASGESVVIFFVPMIAARI